VAEQSVITNTVNRTSNDSSGGTRLAERPAQSRGAGGTATSIKAAGSTSKTAGSTSAASTASGKAATSAESGRATTQPGRGTAEPKAIPFAAVSFVSGLVGLLVANLLLGPLAIILGLIGLRADSGRRARATLGILLGIADIAVFVLLAAHSGAHHGSLSWNFLNH
jgi:hypothetical protein